MQRFRRGYSIIELLFALALLALLSNMAISGLLQDSERAEGQILITELTRQLQFARSSAVTRQQLVTFCPSPDKRKCGGSWSGTVLLFEDPDNDRVMNMPHQLIREFSVSSGTGALTLRSFPDRQFVQFTPEGFTRGQSGNLTWCPNSNNRRHAVQLIFTYSGRIRQASDLDGDGIVETARNKPLNCAAV